LIRIVRRLVDWALSGHAGAVLRFPLFARLRHGRRQNVTRLLGCSRLSGPLNWPVTEQSSGIVVPSSDGDGLIVFWMSTARQGGVRQSDAEGVGADRCIDRGLARSAGGAVWGRAATGLFGFSASSPYYSKPPIRASLRGDPFVASSHCMDPAIRSARHARLQAQALFCGWIDPARAPG